MHHILKVCIKNIFIKISTFQTTHMSNHRRLILDSRESIMGIIMVQSKNSGNAAILDNENNDLKLNRLEWALPTFLYQSKLVQPMSGD